MNADLYTDYEKWKDWTEDKFFKTSNFEQEYLENDFRGIELSNRNFLEIGFGNGYILNWAKSKGARIYGTEMNEILRDRASKNGVTVLPVDISASLPEMTEAFDVIAAYDVLEHIDFDSVISLMNSLEKLLKPGGHIVFRFPNGQSPFGRYLQHADYTHKSTLSSAIMTQIISGTRLILVRDDQGSFTARGSLIQSIPSYLKHIIRKTIEKFIRVIFDIRCELSPNIVLVLRKKM